MPNLLNSYIGDYQLTDFLGAGGMGDVYRAVHRKIDRMVAIKVLTCFDPHTQYGNRFVNEARIQAGLHHPNIATLYDFVEFEGRPCIIMEYVDGQTVHERISEYGPLPIDESLSVFKSVARAISYIHQKGILHRDIKSNNIKISSSGQVKLLDFGIAKDTITPKLTLDGHYVGSLYYLSPEQLMGNKVGQPSDIWSLGILLYELITGELPFETQSLDELCEKIKKADHAIVAGAHPDIPEEIKKILDCCLKKNPGHRFASVEEMMAAIDSAFFESSIRQPDKQDRKFFSIFSDLCFRLLNNRKRVSVVLVACAGIMLMLFLLINGLEKNIHSEGQQITQDNSAAAVTKSFEEKLGKVKIDTYDGKADVYMEGQHVGQTPYAGNFPVGSKINICLKRQGYQDKVIEFEVGEIDSQYSYSLDNRER